MGSISQGIDTLGHVEMLNILTIMEKGAEELETVN